MTGDQTRLELVRYGEVPEKQINVEAVRRLLQVVSTAVETISAVQAEDIRIDPAGTR